MPSLTRRRNRPAATPQAVTAAASRVRLNKPGDGKSASLGKPQDWQPRCVQAARIVGEVGAVADFYSGVMSKLRLFVGAVGESEMPDPLPDPTEEQDTDPDSPAAQLPAQLVADAQDILDRLRPFLSSLLFNAEWNCWTQGEAFVLGRDNVIDENLTDPAGGTVSAETWEVRVRAELKQKQGKLWLEEPGKKPLALGGADNPDVFIFRIWRPDPEHPSLPDSSVRRVLDRCEQMEILDRAINATALARLANAGLMVWDRKTIPQRGDLTQDQLLQTFQDEVTNVLTQAVGDPGAASAVAPFHVFIDPGEKPVKDIVEKFDFQRSIDEYLARSREETLKRIAQGLNAAPERVFGLADATHWNAFLVTEDEWKSYLEPDAVLLVTSFTVGLLRPLLVQLYGHSADDAALIGFGYDAGHIVVRPNRAADALTLHKEFVLSDAALIEAHGFDPADLAGPEERALRIALARGVVDTYLTQALLTEYGEVPDLMVERPVGPTGGGYEPTREGDQPAPTPGQPQGPVPTQAAVRPLRLAVTAAAARPDAGRRLGERLLALDRQTRTRLHGACEAALRAALARYGSKLAAKTRGKSDLAAAILGVPDTRIAATLGKPVVLQLNVPAPDPSWFTDLADLAGRQLSAASERALGLIADYLDADPSALADVAAALDAARPVAVGVLVNRLTALLNDRLFSPDPQVDETLPGEVDPAALVPAGLLRGVLALAGGWPTDLVDPATGMPTFTPDGPAARGLGFGDATWGALDDAGESISGYLWSYGDAPRTPFEPHADLDGIEGAEPTDDVFANDEGWPYVDWFTPGDHDGCLCDLQPVLAGDAQGAYARGALPPDFSPTEGETVPSDSVTMPPGLEGPHPVAASSNGART